MGRARLRLRERRCLRRSPLLRHGHHHAAARGPRLPSRRHRAARLARSGVRHHARRTASGLPRLGRQHGLDGQPLHGREEAPPLGRIFARRQGWSAPRSRLRRLRKPHPPHVQEDARHPRRHRGEPASLGALRLLVGLPQALHPARLGRRPHLLRHGRAIHHRDCGRPGQRPLRP